MTEEGPTTTLGIVLIHLLIAALVLISGTASGLTVGYLSLDSIQIRTSILEASKSRKKKLQRVLNLIENHHDLLVTLLLSNCLVIESLPVVLEKAGYSTTISVMISVTLVLVFGEVIPQALCLSAVQLPLAMFFAPIVQIIMTLMFPVRWPIARILDKFLGEGDGTRYARSHLKTLIKLHEKDDTDKSRVQQGSVLGHDEVKIIEGAMNLAKKTLLDVLIPIEKVYMLEIDQIINKELIDLIISQGHSRIPVYQKNIHHIEGLILVKHLLGLDLSAKKTVRDLMNVKCLIFASPEAVLYDILSEFRKGYSHIAFVTVQYKKYINYLSNFETLTDDCKILGIATLEDIIEEVIQKKIYDEFDKRKPGSIDDDSVIHSGVVTSMIHPDCYSVLIEDSENSEESFLIAGA